MEIKVNEQTQRFYLALEDKWLAAVGHGIMVGKHHFYAIPNDGVINVSETSTGMKVFDITVNLAIMIMTDTKEGFMAYLYEIGERLKRVIERDVDFDKKLNISRKFVIDRLGEMPSIEDVDLEMMSK